MSEKDTKEPTILPLDEKQKQAVLENLRQRGGTFFTWEQLQNMLLKLGPDAKVEDLLKTLKENEGKTGTQ